MLFFSITVLPSQPNLLASTSGDGTLKVWDFLRGAEVSSKTCFEDAGMKTASAAESNGDNKEEGEPQIPAVKTLNVILKGEATLLAVTVQG